MRAASGGCQQHAATRRLLSKPVCRACDVKAKQGEAERTLSCRTPLLVLMLSPAWLLTFTAILTSEDNDQFWHSSTKRSVPNRQAPKISVISQNVGTSCHSAIDDG